MHQYGPARVDFEQAIRLNPTLAAAYVNLGMLSEKNNSIDTAINYYEKAIEADPKHAFAYVQRGKAYEHKADLSRAMADFQSAIELDPKLAPAYYARGYARVQDQNNPELAIGDLNTAIKLDPTFPSPFTARGLAYEKQGRKTEAIADFNAALAIPLKCDSGSWAHDTARAHLDSLTANTAGAVSTRPSFKAADNGSTTAQAPPAAASPPTPSAPKVETCIAKARSTPSIADLIKNDQFPPELRKALAERLGNPPSCAPNPAALAAIGDCIQTETDQIKAAYNDIRTKLASSSSCRPLTDYGEMYKSLAALKKRSASLEPLIKDNLFTCQTTWNKWLDERATRTDQQVTSQSDPQGSNGNSSASAAPTSERFAQRLDQIIGRLRTNLKEAAGKQTEVREAGSRMGDSLEDVLADLAQAMLMCKVSVPTNDK
jgi:tetratricopeptide (TPR) repeat protein/flagellar hook-basal body complex protein FliE